MKDAEAAAEEYAIEAVKRRTHATSDQMDLATAFLAGAEWGREEMRAEVLSMTQRHVREGYYDGGTAAFLRSQIQQLGEQK